MVIHGKKEKVLPKSDCTVVTGGLQIEKERDWGEGGGGGTLLRIKVVFAPDN